MWLLSCVLACIGEVALIILVALLATSKPAGAGTSIHGAALAALILDIMGLATHMAFVLLPKLRLNILAAPSKAHQSVWTLAAILPGFVAAIITIAVLGRLKSDHIPELESGSKAILNASFGMWCLSVLAQGVFYTLSFSASAPFTRRSDNAQAGSTESSRNQKSSASLVMSILPPPPQFYSAPQSPTLSGHSSPRSSIRTSIQHVLLPMGSRTRLLRQASFQSDKGSYNDPPIPIVREGDAFDTWEVDLEAYEAAAARPRLRLETIPQSRPVSPADALDGPFPENDDDNIAPEDLPLPESPILQSEALSTFAAFASNSYSPTTSRFPFPLVRRPSTASTTNNDQSHIHPLFRTDSPAPPPAASPGTIVTASPYGGQIITDPEHAATFARPGSSRQNSRPGSPNVLSPLSPNIMSSLNPNAMTGRGSSIKSANLRPSRETLGADAENDGRKMTPLAVDTRSIAAQRRESESRTR